MDVSESLVQLIPAEGKLKYNEYCEIILQYNANKVLLIYISKINAFNYKERINILTIYK
jgi:hypothetical protein